MPTDEFYRRKRRLFERLKEADKLDESIKEEILDLYGPRGRRALRVIKNDGVRKEGNRWFVQGREDEYEVVSSHCSCFDYVLNIATEKADVDMCYHALAKNIRELLDFE